MLTTEFRTKNMQYVFGASRGGWLCLASLAVMSCAAPIAILPDQVADRGADGPWLVRSVFPPQIKEFRGNLATLDRAGDPVLYISETACNSWECAELVSHSFETVSDNPDEVRPSGDIPGMASGTYMIVLPVQGEGAMALVHENLATVWLFSRSGPHIGTGTHDVLAQLTALGFDTHRLGTIDNPFPEGDQ